MFCAKRPSCASSALPSKAARTMSMASLLVVISTIYIKPGREGRRDGREGREAG